MKLLQMIEDNIKSGVDKAKKELSTTVESVRPFTKPVDTYHIKQLGSSTSARFTVSDSNKNIAYEFKPNFGFRVRNKFCTNDGKIVGSITAIGARHGIGMEIVEGDASCGSVKYTREKLLTGSHTFKSEVPNWDIEKTLAGYSLKHNGEIACTLTFLTIRHSKVEVYTKDHATLALLMCLSILLIKVLEWRSEKEASCGG